MRIYSLQNKFAAGIKYTFLAIDIPKNSEQTPKAMEQVFATITGAHQDISKRAKITKGEIQPSFSFELISIDGYVQFLVRTPVVWRDLVEAAIYAHYSDAEITEVEDYTKDIPTVYPNDTHKIWGADLTLTQNEAFPLRTYRSFEDPLSQEIKDPVASMIETMSRVQKNEQIWLQIILVPTENSQWVKRVLKQAYKMAGKKVESGSKAWYTPILNILFRLPDFLMMLQVESAEEKSKKDDADSRMLYLTPGERASVEAVEMKASKLGFVCKIRLVYVSTLEQFQPSRVVSSVFGSIKQFGDLTSNSLKPNKKTKTSVVYFPKYRIDPRRTKVMRNYKARDWYAGAKSYILNVEELATLYHFPSITVKSSLLKRTEAKKSDAPTQLPTIEASPTASYTDLRSQLEGMDLNNDYYEKKYALNASDENKSSSSATPSEPTQQSSAPDNLPTLPQ